MQETQEPQILSLCWEGPLKENPMERSLEGYLAGYSP